MACCRCCWLVLLLWTRMSDLVAYLSSAVPCPCPLGGLLVVKPGIFSKGQPFPRQRQALVPNRWWGWHTAAKPLASGAKLVSWSVLARLLFHCWLSPPLTKLTAAGSSSSCSASSLSSWTELTWALECLLLRSETLGLIFRSKGIRD